jgi:hypothetical protein
MPEPIPFYIPEKHKPKRKWTPPSICGHLLERPKPPTPKIEESHGIKITYHRWLNLFSGK